jgi:hypothetical protein
LGGFSNWFFEGVRDPRAGRTIAMPQAAWWKVMCLTGVDYFSTLAYQPGIAFLAAGALAPLATFFLVLLTLFGALPIYMRVASQSPNGHGSLSMLEEMLPRWRGKAIVLCLLGFAATDFIITITLSAADATAHIIRNPLVPDALNHPIPMTLLLLVLLAAAFLIGFRQAIGFAVVSVAVYLVMNVIVIVWGLTEIGRHPEYWPRWRATLFSAQLNPATMFVAALLLFPKLALGLSGFETGVTVMPLVTGDRIRNTKKLLVTAALIMSVFLMGSSIVTTLLIPASAFQPGGPADGRALAYLAHAHLGETFGTLYDLSTVVILWFAGASAMTGLLNLVPRYLPRYGMAPEWTGATRPLVVLLTAIAFVITVLFGADVDAQGAAYATGVLVLMTSAAAAVTLSVRDRRRKWIAYTAVTVIFVYTTIENIIARPDGVKIASWFIIAIIVTSLISRVMRSTELRVHGVDPDRLARAFFAEAAQRPARIIANRPDSGLPVEYADKLREARDSHNLEPDEPVMFLEVQPANVSDFSDVLRVEGVDVGGHHVLRCKSPAVPNAIAALLLYVRDHTSRIPHAYFGWTEGNPVVYFLKFLAFGEGDTAPVTREVLRQAEPNPQRRPRIHLG